MAAWPSERNKVRQCSRKVQGHCFTNLGLTLNLGHKTPVPQPAPDRWPLPAKAGASLLAPVAASQRCFEPHHPPIA